MLKIIFYLFFVFFVSEIQAAPSCGMTTTGLAFGNINPLSPSQPSSTASITLNCTGGPVSYVISLSKGNGAFTQRTMLSGSNSLNYNIYTSSAYTTIVGDGTSSSLTINGSFATDPASATHTLYGRISNLNLWSTFAGAYTDNIAVTVTY